MKALRRILGGLVVVLAFCAISSRAQPSLGGGGGTYTGPALLDSWQFSDTNWLSYDGYSPLGFTNLVLSTNGDGGASLLLDSTNTAFIHYAVVETNNHANFIANGSDGSFSFWFMPSWSSADQPGGSGPGGWGRLLEIGAFTTNPSDGCFSLYFSPDGQNICFTTEDTNGVYTNVLSAPVSFMAGTWHFLALTYSSTNTCSLYCDGALLTNGPALTLLPDSAALSNGFALGSDYEGSPENQAQGTFDDLYAYRGESSSVFISGTYNIYGMLIFGVTNFASSAPFVSQLPGPTNGFSAVTGPGFLQWVGTATNVTNGGQVYIANPIAVTSSNFTSAFQFSIGGGTNGLPYDVFATAALIDSNLPDSEWFWLGQGYTGNTYLLEGEPAVHAFYILGTPQDTDGDGLTDAYELLVSHTDPDNPDTSYSGLGDGWYVAYGLNPLNPVGVPHQRLGLWRFNSLTFQGEQEQLPLANIGLTNALATGMEGDAVDMSGTNGSKWLAYHDFNQSNSMDNFNLRSGTIRFWFMPRWSSVTNGGSGLGAVSPLISIGKWTSNAVVGEWRIVLDTNGDRISLDTQDAAGHTVTVPWGVIPGGMVSNQWHQIAATYSPTNAAIYVDGSLVTSNGGLSNVYPSSNIRSLGMFIGTDSAGTQNSQGAFDLLDTYNYSIDPSQISAYTNQSLALPPVLLTNISVTDPVDVKWTASNYVYVLSGTTATITEFDTNWSVLRSLSGIGSNPKGFDVDTNGIVYVAMAGSNQVWRFIPSSNTFKADTNFNIFGYIGRFDGTAGSGMTELSSPSGVALSADGTAIYVADTTNNRVQKFSTNGTFLLSIGGAGTNFGQFSSPQGIHLGLDLSLYVADTGNNRVARLLGDGVYAMFGANGTAPGQLQSPLDVSADAVKIYVADAGNNRVQKLDWSTQIPILVLSSQFGLNQPHSVSLANDPAQERVYIADTSNDRIVVVAVPEADPLPAWNSMKSSLTNGDVETALSQFSTITVDNYRAMFAALGTSNVSQVMSNIGQLTPLEVDDDQARYYFDSTINGVDFSFIVTFVNEYGIWKIRWF